MDDDDFQEINDEVNNLDTQTDTLEQEQLMYMKILTN